MNKIEQKVLKFVDRHLLIENGDNVLVALSGGADSIFVLYLLNKFKKRFGISLLAMHVHHQLRGKEADDDQKFCQTFCENIGVKFFTNKVDVKSFAKKNKYSIEEAARILRYAELKKIAENYSVDKIVTAHNLNDNTETVLLNLFRGTGLSGISGIPVKRENIIRPILCLSKIEIKSYLEKSNISFCIDSTNFNNDFNRNYIRNKLIPLIEKEINPSIHNTIEKSTEIFRTNNRLLNSIIQKLIFEFVKIENESLIVNLNIVEKFGEDVLGEVFHKILKENFDYEYKFEDYLKLIGLVRNQTGSKIELTDNLEAFRSRKEIVLKKQKTQNYFQKIDFEVNSKINFENQTLSVFIEEKSDKKFSTSADVEKIDADCLKGELTLRKWKHGDKFIPLGMNKFKKISDFLNEQKVPSITKKDQFVLENNGNIIWVIGLRIDNRYKIKSTTKKICKLWIH